jgi:hypothetical protein
MHMKVKSATPGYLHFHCPGCDEKHAILVESPNAWQWNGSFVSPTFSPSILVRSRLYGPDKLPFSKYDGPFPCEETPSICHSFVTEGKIQFLGDCTHSLANQTVDLPELTDATL